MAAYRDRTNLFISYRQTTGTHLRVDWVADADNGESAVLIKNGDNSIEMQQLLPSWNDIIFQIEENLLTISKQSAILQKLYKRDSLPGFGDVIDHEEVQQLTISITAGLHECQNLLGKVSGGQECHTLAGSQICKNIQVALAAKLQDATWEFRKTQSAYLKRKLHSIC